VCGGSTKHRQNIFVNTFATPQKREHVQQKSDDDDDAVTHATNTTSLKQHGMFRTRVVSFSVGFASASAIGLYKLNRDIEKSTQIVLNHVKDAEKRLKGVEEEIAKMKSAAAATTTT
tara:strand:+ start:114 stop:464 length:351 start_codon:yes stop_codon:yes gene_type:complete